MTSLTFTKDSSTGLYKSSFVGTGDAVAVQLNRTKNAPLRFSANIGSMEPTEFACFNSVTTPANFFRVLPNIPNGVTVTIESYSEVTSGGYEG